MSNLPVQAKSTVLQPSGSPLAPTTVGELMEVAQIIAKSGLAPAGFKTAEQVFVAVVTGRELGLSPLQSLNHLFVIRGRVGMFTRVMETLYRRKGYRMQLLESTPAVCRIRFTKPQTGETYTHELTMDECVQAHWDQEWDAEKNRWKKKTTWEGMPRIMLQYRCKSTGIRAFAPEVLVDPSMPSEDEVYDLDNEFPEDEGDWIEGELTDVEQEPETIAEVEPEPEPEPEAPTDDLPPSPHWTDDAHLVEQYMQHLERHNYTRAQGKAQKLRDYPTANDAWHALQESEQPQATNGRLL